MTTLNEHSHPNVICYRLSSIDFKHMVPRIAWIETIKTGEKQPMFLESLYCDASYLEKFSAADIREICTHYVKWQIYEGMYPHWRENSGKKIRPEKQICDGIHDEVFQ